MDYHVKDAT